MKTQSTDVPQASRRRRSRVLVSAGAAFGVAMVGVTGAGIVPSAQAAFYEQPLWGSLDGISAGTGTPQIINGRTGTTPTATIFSSDVGELVIRDDLDGDTLCRTSDKVSDFRFQCTLQGLELGFSRLTATVTTDSGAEKSAPVWVFASVKAPRATAVHEGGVTTVSGTSEPSSTITVTRGREEHVTTTDENGAFTLSFADEHPGAGLIVEVAVPGADSYGVASTIVRVDTDPVPGPDPVVADPSEGAVDEGFAPFPEPTPDPVVADPAEGAVDEGFAPFPEPTPEPVVADPAEGAVDEGFAPFPEPKPEPVVADPNPGVTDPGFSVSPLRFVGTSAGHAKGFTNLEFQTTPLREIEFSNKYGWSTAKKADAEGRVTFEEPLERGQTYTFWVTARQDGDLPYERVEVQTEAWTDPTPVVENPDVRFVGTAAGSKPGYTAVSFQTAPGRTVVFTDDQYGDGPSATANAEGLVTIDLWLEGTRVYDMWAIAQPHGERWFDRAPFTVQAWRG